MIRRTTFFCLFAKPPSNNLCCTTPPPSPTHTICFSLSRIRRVLRENKMSSVFLQPKVSSGTRLAGLGSSYHSAQKNALSGKFKIQSPSARLRVYCMKTWSPINNKKFETLSYVPPLSEESIAKELDYILSKGWVPCLEFDEVGAVHRTNSRIPGYYDGRYWTLWKLPMFGCTDSAQVLREMEECKNTYPNAYIRLISFDSNRQCQCMSFVIQKPSQVAN